MDNIEKRDFVLLALEQITAIRPGSRLNQSSLHQLGQNLGQIRRRNILPFGQLLYAYRLIRRSSDQKKHRMQRIIRGFGVLHLPPQLKTLLVYNSFYPVERQAL
ncbi:hypothetical protein D3C75_1064050 [compost metagenome]